MASAFAQDLAGDKLEVLNAGSAPAQEINPNMVKVMHEMGIDMGFRIPRALDETIARETPEIIITMGCAEQCPFVPGARMIEWDLPDPAGKSLDFMRGVRDEIEKKVQGLVSEIS